MVVAPYEGGRVEVDGGCAIMTNRLRNRMVMARSDDRVEVAA
jgi:hypothetical protein